MSNQLNQSIFLSPSSFSLGVFPPGVFLSRIHENVNKCWKEQAYTVDLPLHVLFLSLHSDRNMKRVPCHAGLLHSYANALNVSERVSSITGALIKRQWLNVMVYCVTRSPCNNELSQTRCRLDSSSAALIKLHVYINVGLYIIQLRDVK